MTKSLCFIIHGGNNQICVDSRDISKEFGRQHKNVLQTIDTLIEDGTISRLEFKLSNYKKIYTAVKTVLGDCIAEKKPILVG